MAEISIARMLKGFGITAPEAQKAAQDALVEAGVISARRNRANIADSKTERARAVLEQAFLWRCRNGDCKREASGVGEPALLVEQAACSVCGGSQDGSALRRMAAAASAANVSRILVAGGTEAKWHSIRARSPNSVEWRFIDGTRSRDDRYFRSDRYWAQIIVLWSSTPLDHRVSSHFDGKGDGRVITVTKRGIAALADGIAQHLERRSASA